jgi:uncharacterized protein
MKLSKYIVISEPIYKGKFQIIFSTLHSSIYLVSYDILTAIIKSKWHLINPVILDELKNKHIVIDDKYDELTEIKNYVDDAIADRKILYYSILPTIKCQFKCFYCGQKHGNYNMSEQIIDLVVQRILTKINNGAFEHLAIGWFGAEPLLAVNKIKTMTQKIISGLNSNITFSASMVTNGVALTPKIFNDLVNLEIKEFEITLDGAERVHNQRRNIGSNYNSFSVIIKNIVNIIQSDLFLKKKVKLILRTNIDIHNQNQWKELIDILIEKNILHYIDDFYVAPIHSWGNDAHKQSLINKEFARLEIEFYSYLIQKGYSPKLLPAKKNRTCLAVTTHDEVFDYEGNVYNCTEIPYVPKYSDTSYILDNVKRENSEFKNRSRMFIDWYENIFSGKNECTNCKILPLCLGACPKAWKENNIPCPSIKYNINDLISMSFS